MLDIKDLSVSFQKAGILNNVNLNVKDRELVFVIGPNGTGKTTLLRAISGLIKPTNGSITFLGERIDGLAPHKIVQKGISHCPERKKIFPEMTVMENIELGAYLKKNKEEIRNNFDRIFSLFPILSERRGQEARRLSGGEQQMLAIARSLMSEPKLLMLDEPSLGLAPKTRDDLTEAIFQIKQSGITVLMVEQNVGLALTLGDRGYLLEEGKVSLEGNANFLKKNSKIKQAYLGSN